MLPMLGVDLPAGQFMQVSVAAAPDWLLNLPMEQFLQAASDVLPFWALYFPAAQSVQTLAEVTLRYVPAGQHAFEVDAIEPRLTPSNIEPRLAVLKTHDGPQRGS